jgi:ligand-binding sensor domain-containing protein/serine phosphatase RsbU (regulator of sigma subunit)
MMSNTVGNIFKSALILSFSLLFFPKNLYAQGGISFKHLTVEGGLSQSAVMCIFQDSHGFMWFGTQDGLNRYDGYNFKVYKNNPSDSTSLSDNFIFSIYEDDIGTMYIQTQSGSFQRYNARTESFTQLSKDSIDVSQFKVSSIEALLYEPGVRWVGGLGAPIGLKRTETESGKITEFKNNPTDPFSIGDDKVYSVYRDRSGSLWVGTLNGLDRLDERTGRFTHYRSNPEDQNSLSYNHVWPIFEDSKGNLWIGTFGGGLNKLDPQRKLFTRYLNDPSDPKSINDNYIFSIYEDRGGGIWIGTNTGGINYFHPSSQMFDLYTNNPSNKNSLVDNDVISMLVDKNGIYWLGTKNGGLDRFDYNKKSFKNYPGGSSDSKNLVSSTITLIYQDKSGVLWLGTLSSGLMEFDPKTGTYKLYQNNPSDPTSLTDNRIYSIFEDHNGVMWIGTYGGGLNKLDRATGKFTNYKFNPDDESSISSNSVWAIIEDTPGTLWLGTFGGGINIFDAASGNSRRIRNIPDNPNSLPDDNIIRIFKDSKNNLWIGTTKGLSRYNRELNNFKNYREKDGLANDFVYGILGDDEGYLWISTNNGLSKFNPEKETFKNYTAQDGLQGNEFNQNAFAKDYKTGRLLFGGVNGFNVFHPDSIKGNTYVPPIVFTNHIRYNSDDEEGKPIIEKGISDRREISLTYKDNIVTFEFAALSYFNSLNNQYRYRLEGFNENWIQLGNENKVTFTNLSAGDYLLRVKGSNNDGVWNDEGITLAITVTPPWWRTNIAYAIYAITFLSLLYGLRRVEINRREQKTKLRENELRLKATEAEKRAIQIEHDRKTKELEEARQLQLSMLPKELPVLPNLEIAAFMRTATEVGGDYYDFIVQENGVLNVAFGDATGHGLQAGTMVTLMKGFFTSDSSKLGLKDFMSHCTRVIKDIKLGRILMSFSYLKIDKNKLEITSAGMPPVFYHHKETNQVEEIIIKGMPLGAMRNVSYNTVEMELKSGDTILLLTDGLPEQMNPNEEMFDYSRVKKHFNEIIENSPNTIIEKLVEAGDSWMNGRVQDDDITFVVIKVK